MPKNRIIKTWSTKGLKYRLIKVNVDKNRFTATCSDCKFKINVNDSLAMINSSFGKDLAKKLQPDILTLKRYYCTKKHIFIILPLGCDEKNE